MSVKESKCVFALTVVIKSRGEYQGYHICMHWGIGWKGKRKKRSRKEKKKKGNIETCTSHQRSKVNREACTVLNKDLISQLPNQTECVCGFGLALHLDHVDPE